MSKSKAKRQRTPRKMNTTGVVSPLLSIREATDYLRIAQSTIYTKLAEFEVVHLGRRVFITRKSADAWIERSMTRPRKARRSIGYLEAEARA